MPLHVIDHPLLAVRLAAMRQHDTPPSAFRRLMREAGTLLAFEALRDLAVRCVDVDTPLERVAAPVLAEVPCFVPVLRAGLGLLDGMLELVPEAVVGHVGLVRDPASLTAGEYYAKLPPGLASRPVVVADPMLATGGSAIAALDRLRAAGAVRMRVLCLVAAPEGVAAVARSHPAVDVWTAALDRGLDAHGYIRPGLGDAGDRLFGT